MRPLPDFDEAQARMTPAEYHQYLHGVSLSAVALEAVTASVSRQSLTDSRPLDATVSTGEIRLDVQNAQHPALLLDFLVQALSRRRAALRIKATYRLQLTSERELSDEFLAIYARVSANIQIWPFLRELIYSMTQRMGIPTLVLPLQVLPSSAARAGAEGEEPMPTRVESNTGGGAC